MPEHIANAHRTATRTPGPMQSGSRSLSRCNRDRFLECLQRDTRQKLYFPNEPIRKSYFNPGFPPRTRRVGQTRPRG